LAAVLADELEPPDGEARLSLGLPVLVDVVEAVIAEAARRRVDTAGVPATNHSHRQALAAALGQRRVAQGESLVGDLALGCCVVAALAGVDDEVPEVVVVFVASRDNDRVGAFCGRAGNAGLQLSVDPCAEEGAPVREGRPYGYSIDVSEDPHSHHPKSVAPSCP
jgi:hypothetical protein